MSTEHKAFIFDYENFLVELKPILEGALTSGDCSGLEFFIDRNFDLLSDPYEGEKLTHDWRRMMEEVDAHQLGDFALTKYYDPSSDFGLSYDWREVQDLLDKRFGLGVITVLGEPVGPPDNVFDPGKMGAYFQSAESVAVSFEMLNGNMNSNTKENIRRFIGMLEQAASQKMGIYVTF